MMLVSTPAAFRALCAFYDGFFHILERYPLAVVNKTGGRILQVGFREGGCGPEQERISMGIMTWPLLESFMVSIARIR